MFSFQIFTCMSYISPNVLVAYLFISLSLIICDFFPYVFFISFRNLPGLHVNFSLLKCRPKKRMDL